PRLRLVECKASRKDRTYHRVQVVLYRLIVGALLAAAPVSLAGFALRPEDVECVVARIDEATNTVHDVLALEALDLDMEEADVLGLLAPGGPLCRILATPLDTLDYQLDARCDECVFNVHCLPESARQRRLELLGMDPATAHALRANGIRTLDDLAELDP